MAAKEQGEPLGAEAPGTSDPATRRARQRATWLLLGRLALCGVSFGIALGLEGPQGELSDREREGLYWTVGLALFVSAVSGAYVHRIRRLVLFGTLQIVLDVAIVTSLVHFSGARESVFAFLYPLVVLYGALLFERWGALGAATLSALCYGAVLVLAIDGGSAGAAIEDPLLPRLIGTFSVHVGALYLVGALASVLAGELRRTGQALDRRTHDLRRLQRLHQRTVESLLSGLLTTDSEGRVTSFNPEAERITGLALARVLGEDIEEVIPGVRELAMQASAQPPSPEATRARLRYRNRRGEELFLGLAGSILRDEAGESGGRVVIFQDVTQVVAMERQLRRSERLAAVGELSAKIAHEIRNPLASISGSIQILRSDPKLGLGSEPQRLMDIAVREADRLNDLIRDFLQFARPKAPQATAVVVDEVIEEVLELLAPSLPANVRVSVASGAGVAALADPDQLKQVLWNLVLNGVQSMPEGGELCLGVKAVPVPFASRGVPQGSAGPNRNAEEGAHGDTSPPGWVELRIEDSGAGMSAEVQEQIFEPFFTTRKEGSGLGLATVHRIVESHGGTLQVESEQGRGTVFRVGLPRAQAPSRGESRGEAGS